MEDKTQTMLEEDKHSSTEDNSNKNQPEVRLTTDSIDPQNLKNSPTSSEIGLSSTSNPFVEDKEQNSQNSNRSCCQRYFGAMKEGSLRGSIFSMCACCLGLGAFSLPIRCTQFGCVNYLIAVFLGGVALYWSLTIMITSARKVNGFDYSRSVKLILGNKAGYVIDIAMIIDLFGFLTSNQVIIYSLIGRTFYDFFGDKIKYATFDDYDKNVWSENKIKFIVMFGTVILLFPFCILKNISEMRFISVFAIIILMYSIFVIIIESPFFWIYYKENVYKEDDISTHANWFDIRKAFNGKKLFFFQGMASVFFSYTCQHGAFPIYKTLKNNNEKRTNKVFFRAAFLIFLVYFLVTFAGFLTNPIDPEDLIIYRKSIFKNDIFMTISKIGIAVSIFCSFPANYAPFRCSIFELFFKTDKIDKFKNIIVTVSFLGITCLIAAVYKNILDYISLCGGFLSSIICFIIPGSMYIKSNELKLSHPKNVITIIVVCILSAIGFSSGVQTIIEAFTGENE